MLRNLWCFSRAAARSTAQRGSAQAEAAPEWLWLSKWDMTHTSSASALVVQPENDTVLNQDAAWRWEQLSKQEELHTIREGKHTLAEHGASSHQMKRLLWHQPDLFLPAPPPCHLVLSPGSSSVWPLGSLVSATDHGDSSPPDHLVDESLGTFFHGMCFGIQPAHPCPFRKDFAPSTPEVEHFETVVCRLCIRPIPFPSCGTVLGHWPKNPLLVQAAGRSSSKRENWEPVKNRNRRCP